jgi:TetR/AcrR family transcriptional regulator, cholesterol catabolism regulator
LKGSKRKVDRPRTSVPDTASNPLGVRTLEERRALILETAASRFEAKGYAGTSVDEIARALGITKAAVYHYWGSKEELLEGIQDHALALLREKLDRLDEEDSPYETHFEATVAAYIDAVLENKSFVSVLLRDFVSSERTREKQRAFRQQCRETLEKEIAAGNVRDSDPEVLTLAIVGLCSTIASWYEPAGRLSPEEVKKVYLGLVTRGLLPLPQDLLEPGQPSDRSYQQSPRSCE